MKISIAATLFLLAPLVSAASKLRKLPENDGKHGGIAGDAGDWITEEGIPTIENITQDGVDWIEDTTGLALCFSGVTTVQTPSGMVPMSELQVGDSVLGAAGNYEPVLAWAHKQVAQKAEFLQFNNELEMTAAHLVFVEGTNHPARADSIKVGDVLQGMTVNKISKVTRKGVYTPLTPSGTVVVNGVTSSSYVSLQENTDHVQLQNGIALMSFQDFIHLALSPLRLFLKVQEVSYNEQGIPTFAAAGIDLANWAMDQPVLLQAFLFLAFLAVTGISMIFEKAPLAVLAGAGAYALSRKIAVRKLKTV